MSFITVSKIIVTAFHRC